MVDTNSPNDYSHIHDPNVGKKYHLKKMKFRNIEYENRKLMGKMYEILNRKPEQPQARGKSLNCEKRKKEQRRISQENRILTKHLINAQPSINRKHLEKHAFKVNYSQNELYKKNISTFCDGIPKKPMFHPPMTSGVRTLYSTKSPSLNTSAAGFHSKPTGLLPRISQERGSLQTAQDFDISAIGSSAVETVLEEV